MTRFLPHHLSLAFLQRLSPVLSPVLLPMLLPMLLLVLLLTSFTTTAGSRREALNPQFNQQQLFDFSKQVERTAANLGARVFLLARVGRASAQLPKGIEYSHTGIAVYSMITTAEGKKVPGYSIYNLYQNEQDPSKSELVTDYPVDFFAGAHQLKAGIVIPTMALQKKLLTLMASGDFNALHNPNYSLLANPFNSQFQNCTEFTLDLLNAAIYQTDDIKQLKANSKAHFTAQRVKQSGFKLAMAAWLMDDLSLKDHDKKVHTATFSTIARYLQDNDLVKTQLTVMP